MRQNWDKLGATDPLWAILNDASKTGNRWELEEFFASGVREVRVVLEHVQGIHSIPSGPVLDFGCGVGRLTQALAEHFEEVVGVDISVSMIEKARKYNRHGARCQFVLNPLGDLRIFPDARFSFIYSSITLQHMRPRYSKRYLEELLRVLTPGGVLVFQLPSGLAAGRWRAAKRASHALYYHVFHPVFRPGKPVIEMHPVPKEAILELLTARGASVLDMTPDQSAGKLWESYRYTVTRNQGFDSTTGLLSK